MRNALLKTHDETQCGGEHCCIHNPSEHHMRTWPLNWRNDTGVMERICPHGVGHPDPDDDAHNVRIGREYLTVHGCDGCCRPNDPSSSATRLGDNQKPK
jgi:hypothetical protein